MLAKDGKATGITVGYSSEGYGEFRVNLNDESVTFHLPCVIAQERKKGKGSARRTSSTDAGSEPFNVPAYTNEGIFLRKSTDLA